MKTFKYLIKFLILILIINCSSEKKDWESIRNSNDIRLYEDFVNKYPNGTFTDSANIGIEKIYFKEAVKLDSNSIYQDFKNKFPNSIWLDSINSLIEKKEILAIVNKNSIDDLKNYINTNPNSKYILNAKLELENLEFREIIYSNSIKDFKSFLLKYPNSIFRDSINVKIKYLKKLELEKLELKKLESEKLELEKLEEDKIPNQYEVNNSNGKIFVKVLKGNLKLINGMTARKGSALPVNPLFISYKEGKTLFIVGEGGVYFRGKKYSKGTKLIINIQGKIEDVR